MQTPELIKTLDQMTDDELLERLRTVRHNREVARPVATKKAATAEKKTSRKRVTDLDKLLAGMTEEERQQLINSLSEDTNDN